MHAPALHQACSRPSCEGLTCVKKVLRLKTCLICLDPCYQTSVVEVVISKCTVTACLDCTFEVDTTSDRGLSRALVRTMSCLFFSCGYFCGLCSSLAASLVFLCGFFAGHLAAFFAAALRAHVPSKFLPWIVFLHMQETSVKLTVFALAVTLSNPSNPLQPTWLGHRKTSWKDPAKIPQGPRTDPARNAEDPQGSLKRKNPLKATSVVLQRRTAPTQPLPIKQKFLHVELQVKHAKSTKARVCPATPRGRWRPDAQT